MPAQSPNIPDSPLSKQYQTQGYFVLRNFLDIHVIERIRTVVESFQQQWIADNLELYREEAFNSSLITGSQYLCDEQRLVLFEFISSTELMDIIEQVVPNQPAFMNTQLFFNPQNPEQKDFWHRDCQYDFAIEEQKHIIQNTQVVHLRVPLYPERGMELIAGTHLRWDTPEELNVREELNGRHNHEDLPNSTCIALEPGDILVFSADMIHRGLYGLDRLALDILVFDSSGDYADYVDDDCLPTPAMLQQLNNPSLFLNTLKLKAQPKR